MVITVTMEDIKAIPDDWLAPATVASVMHMNPGRLIQYAKEGQLPFPVAVSGNRVKIGRVGFLRFYGYETPEEPADKAQRLQRIDERLEQITQLLKEILERSDRSEGRMEMDQAGA